MSSSLYEELTRNDEVEPADLILVLAGRMDRKHYGFELFRTGLAPRLVLSVGRFEVSRMPQLDLDCIVELKSLRDATPPRERHFFVIVDGSGTRIETANIQRCSTYGEAVACRRFLESQTARKVMVISSDIHLRRVALTFATVFSGSTTQFLFCPLPHRFGNRTKDNWWRRSEDRRFVVSEMIKLIGYRLALSTPEWASRRLMQLTGRGWG